MLSRVHDTRVFTGSHDVVYSDATDRDAHKRLVQRPLYARMHQQLGPTTTTADNDDASDSSSDALSADDSADEYEYFRDSRHPPSAALHPHHPYNTQLRALAPSPRAARGGTVTKRSSSSRRHGMSAERAPMEFVYLPSGEIRPRDECPPGLLLPPPASSAPPAIAADAFRRSGRHSEQQQRTYRAPASGRTRQSHVSSDSDASLLSGSEAPVRRRRDNNRHASDPTSQFESLQRQSASASEHESDNGNRASEDESESGESALDEKENVQTQQTRRDAHKRPPSTDRAPVTHTAKHERERSADRRPEHRHAAPSSSSERQRRSGDAEDADAPQQQEPRRQPSATSHQTEQEPAHARKRASKQSTQAAPSDAVRAHAVKSTKLDVRDLLSDHAPLRAPPVRSAPSSALRKQVADLERALQSEKQRVLETMTQVLDAQRSAQDRAHDVARLEAQLAAKDHETDRRVRDAVAKEQAHWSARVSALEADAQAKDAAVAALETNVRTLESELQHPQSAAATSRSSPVTQDQTQQQMEKIVAKLRKFHARVERWKRSSRAATDVCASPADVASLLDALWRDFPALPLRELVTSDAPADDSTRASNEPAHMVAFLTKRLRLREDELAQTHAKYGELKELCARQCVREADLQNFINEHRLRGNLVIRNTGTAAATDNTNTNTNNGDDGASDDRRKTVQFHAQGGSEQRTRERSARASTSRATNTPPVYFAADDDVDDGGDDDGGGDDRSGDEATSGEDDDRQGYDCDEDETSEAQSAYLVREPKVFVQVGRDGVFEHAGASSAVLRKLEDERMRQQLASRSSARPRRDVERIRLVPSPALARRYERVPPTETRRKAPSAAATPVRSSTRSSVRQPPSISATRSANSAARRRAAPPQPLPRASGSVRSGSVTSSRNSRIAAAPWV